MQITNLTLAYQIAELKPLIVGAIVRKIQELPNNWLKFRLQTRQGSKDLIVSKQVFYLSSHYLPAKQQTSGYAAFLRKQLKNKKIVSLQQHGFDRIALLGFDSFFLIFEFFAKGNIILTDKDFQIVSAYRKEQWKDRITRKGAKYNFPSSKGINPNEISLLQLKKIFKESILDLVRTIIGKINVAPIIAEEVCFELDLPKTIACNKLREKDVKAVLLLLQKFYSVDLKKLQPVLVKKNAQLFLLPFTGKLSQQKIERKFSSLNAAFDSLLPQEIVSGSVLEKESQLLKRINALKHSLAEQQKAKGRFEKAVVENRKKAELIFKHYADIEAIARVLREAIGAKEEEKSVMYKLKNWGKKVKKIDFQRKKIFLELK